MLKDITLGQFFPGDTLAHKLDPRTKLLVTVLYVVALFTAKSYIAYGVLILTLIVAVRISRVGAKALFKGLKPVLFIIAFTALLNLFYTPGRLSRPSVRRMGEVVYVSRNVPMIKSVMRSIIVMAARTPSIVMRKIQKWHSSVPGV